MRNQSQVIIKYILFGVQLHAKLCKRHQVDKGERRIRWEQTYCRLDLQQFREEAK